MFFKPSISTGPKLSPFYSVGALVCVCVGGGGGASAIPKK